MRRDTKATLSHRYLGQIEPRAGSHGKRMLNGKPSTRGYITGFALGTGFVLLVNVLSAPHGDMLKDAVALMLFLALGVCVLFWFRRRQ